MWYFNKTTLQYIHVRVCLFLQLMWSESVCSVTETMAIFLNQLSTHTHSAWYGSIGSCITHTHNSYIFLHTHNTYICLVYTHMQTYMYM